MSNVLIRDVPDDDLDQIRTAAAENGTSLQRYLRDTVHAQATHLRRQQSLARARERLRGQPEAPEEARVGVFDAMDAEHAQRAEQLGDRSQR